MSMGRRRRETSEEQIYNDWNDITEIILNGINTFHILNVALKIQLKSFVANRIDEL